MTDTISTPSSQPTDLVARFEPARAAVAPKACYRGKLCWVATAKLRGTGGGGGECLSCKGSPTIAGNEAKHAAVLRRCMASQNEASP